MPRQLGSAGLAWDTFERLAWYTVLQWNTSERFERYSEHLREVSLGARLDGFPGRDSLPLLLICPATPLFLQHQQHQFVLQQTPCSPCNAILLESALPTVPSSPLWSLYWFISLL